MIILFQTHSCSNSFKHNTYKSSCTEKDFSLRGQKQALETLQNEIPKNWAKKNLTNNMRTAKKP